MAYGRDDGRHDSRRGWRGERPRMQDEDRWSGGRRDERGFFERAGDEIASWFGDDEADRRREMDDRAQGRGRFAGRWDQGREHERAFLSDEEFERYERHPRWRDEGYRRPYTGRFSGQQDRGSGYRPMTGDYGRFEDERSFTAMSSSGSPPPAHDRHYDDWRRRQIEALDRDYEDYRREHQSRFEDEFSSWRQTRQSKRAMLREVREHMEVVGSDEQHVGTVDRVAGDRIILAKSDPDSGGSHHSLSCTLLDRIEGDRLILSAPAEEARRQWRDDSRERALFEREDQGQAGPGVLNRSFSGTY